MGALLKIKAAGFDVSLIGDSFEVSPASLLTQNQREFLKTHKAEIIAELNLIVTCWTPSGVPIEVQARDADHAAWLLKMNPSPVFL